jgi:hypothetical protein
MKAFSFFATTFLLLTTSLAFAGERASSPVYLNGTSRYAGGAQGSARNSPDNLQSIGCQVTAFPGGGAYAAYVSCSARDNGGKGAWCYSYDPALVAAGNGISNEDQIAFTWNPDGTCSMLQIYKGSNLETKQP